MNPVRAIQCTPIASRFYARLKPIVPSAFLIEIPNARLMGAHGWIIGDHDSHLLDCSFWAYPDDQLNISDHLMLRRRIAPSIHRLSGRTLSLASDYVIGGFGHFLHDSLTRLHLLELAGINPSEFDWIYLPHLNTPNANSLFAASGLPPERVVSWNPTLDYECDSLTATTFPGRPGHIAPTYSSFLRRQFKPTSHLPQRKLYLSRRGYRRDFRNAADVDDLLARHGFEACYPHCDPQVLSKCASATHVVAIEGANFLNIFACAPGTKALLILPDAGPTLPYCLTLASSAELALYLLAARSLDQPTTEPGIADVHVDLAQLSTALEQMNC